MTVKSDPTTPPARKQNPLPTGAPSFSPPSEQQAPDHTGGNSDRQIYACTTSECPLGTYPRRDLSNKLRSQFVKSFPAFFVFAHVAINSSSQPRGGGRVAGVARVAGTPYAGATIVVASSRLKRARVYARRAAKNAAKRA